MQKVKVNGHEAHPLYQWLTQQQPQLMMSMVKWNFEVAVIK
jgi:glutathione peroxidase